MRKQQMIPAWAVVVSLLCVCHFVAPAGQAAAAEGSLLDQLNDEIASLAEKARPAVVSVISTTNEPVIGRDPFGRLFRLRDHERPRQGLGSGFLIDSTGTILTNNHVVAGTDELLVLLSDGRSFPAKIVGSDPDSEVAVIKIEGEELPYLEIGDSNELRVGEMVFAIGSPQGLPQTITSGIVSGRVKLPRGEGRSQEFVQTDAAINPGNSGGALLNTCGEVVGINTMIYSTSGGSQGMGFAIPVDYALDVADSLRGVKRGYLGILMEELTEEMAEHFDTGGRKGVVVTQVLSGAPAGGKIEVHDAIVAVDGDELEGMQQFRKRIATTEPGEAVRLTVLRNGKEKRIKITLGTRPGPGQTEPVEEPEEKGGKIEATDLGFSIREITEAEGEQVGLGDRRALLITGVDRTSAAWAEGLRPDTLILEVNLKPVSTLEDFHEGLEAGSGKETVMLLIRTAHGDSLRFIPRP